MGLSLVTKRAKEKGKLHFDVHIVASDDRLSANRNDLYFDVHDTQRFAADVDLDQAWIDGLIELAEARDESHGT